MHGMCGRGVLGIRRERLHNVRCGLLLELGRVNLHCLPGWAALGVGLRGVPAVPGWEVPSRLGSQPVFGLSCGNVLCGYGSQERKRLCPVFRGGIPGCHGLYCLRYVPGWPVFERRLLEMLHGAAAVSRAPRRRPWISADPCSWATDGPWGGL